MNKYSPPYNYEIDSVALFKIFWDGKIKILLITIISFFVGIVYNSQIPVNYLNSLTINSNKTIEIVQFHNIQKMLQLNQSNQSNQSNLVRFINDLKDYEEFIMIIKNTKKTQEHLSKLKIEDQEKELFKYTKLLEVEQKNDGENYIINFEWHDPEEAKKILQDTLNLTSKNLKKFIIEELSLTLEFENKLLINQDMIRLDYLKEQTAIAKELKIIDNQIDNVNLSQSNVSLSISTADIAYYLRGYKAIDKEIELIQNRNYQNMKFLDQEINKIKNMELEFVDYNIFLMETKYIKHPTFVLMIFILLGLIIGVFFVLFSSALQSQTASKETR